MNDAFKKGLEGLDSGPRPSDAGGVGAPPQAGDLPPHPSVDALRERFGDAVLRHELVSGDEHIVYVLPDRSLEILQFLRDEPGHRYDFLQDLTAVDYGGGRMIQVVYQLWSVENKLNLRVKAELPLDGLEIQSVYHLWRAADWLEREVYDMFGVVFQGHPDLRRILMPYNYAEGHPLRKDFPLRGRFTRAEQTRRSLSLRTEDHYSPAELEIAHVLGQTVPDPFNGADAAEQQGQFGGMGGGG
ncbi:MAG: NADH-ubiquinone oxidoreductase chain C [uncultured Gemmatimonadetes bacterium]|uniref:NADH-quinone oxidoreductase subunit C n=1 Tax=uncultured Gemmatimonadota bacterium TaxID=203437 RepID=A0A6J4MYR4_9BACT|nr:MAG: NADH-ubiquinone oxidoreductase chain C [uncultured Gemmatimonadota bacterium]